MIVTISYRFYRKIIKRKNNSIINTRNINLYLLNIIYV